MRAFRYARPQALSDAFDLFHTHGANARVLAGGTDLVVGLQNGKLRPDVVIDIKRLRDLPSGITAADGMISIAAPTTMTDVIVDPHFVTNFPALVQAAATVGSVQIRNRATLAGNICNASPGADTLPPLLAYGAGVVLISRVGVRRLPLDEFLIGPRLIDLRPGELLAAVELPLPDSPTGAQFTRLTRRRGVDLATISLCCTVGETITRFAFGAVAPKPFVLTDDSGVLADPHEDPAARRRVLEDFIEHASPISDIRAGRDYRDAMLRVLSWRTLGTAIELRDQRRP